MKEASWKSLLPPTGSEITSRLPCDAPLVDDGVSTDVSLFLVGGWYLVVYSRRRMSRFREGGFGRQKSIRYSLFRAESICKYNANGATRDRTARMGTMELDVGRRGHHSLRNYDIKTCLSG